MYIKIDANQDGSHAYQIGGNLEDGWAVVPDGMELPDTFPFVEIKAGLKTHPAVMAKDSEGNDIVLIPEVTQMEVTTMSEGEEIPQPDEPEVPTPQENANAITDLQLAMAEIYEAMLGGL